jgi:hypothetical protein
MGAALLILVRLLGSAFLGLCMVFVLVSVQFIAGIFLLPHIPGTECGWFICGEDRLPTLWEWLSYSTVVCALVSLPAWGIFVVAGFKPLWFAYATGMLTTIATHLMLTIDILPSVDSSSDTSDWMLTALTLVWVLVPPLAALIAWRVGAKRGYASGSRPVTE